MVFLLLWYNVCKISKIPLGGAMEHSANYEHIIPLQTRRIRILLFSCYLLLATVGTLWIIKSMNSYAFLFTLLGLAVLILLTKNFWYMEYEYSFYSGRFSLSKIYGKRSRRLLAELDAEQLLLVDYDTEDVRQTALRYADKPSVRAVSSVKHSPAMILVWEDEEKEYHRILIERDERLEQLLRRYAPRACSLSFKRGQQ